MVIKEFLLQHPEIENLIPIALAFVGIYLAVKIAKPIFKCFLFCFVALCIACMFPEVKNFLFNFAPQLHKFLFPLTDKVRQLSLTLK